MTLIKTLVEVVLITSIVGVFDTSRLPSFSTPLQVVPLDLKQNDHNFDLTSTSTFKVVNSEDYNSEPQSAHSL